MNDLIELFQHLFHLNFDWLFANYETSIYTVLFLVIFIETGVLIMPFLPGDSLLFTAGLFAAAGKLEISFLLPLLMFAAVLGDNCNYWIGRKFGIKVLEIKIKGKTLINKKYLENTEAFFVKNGVKAIIMARFVPIVRTFAPFAAGVGRMEYKKFFLFDVFGGFLWIFSLTIAGYLLGDIEWIKNNIEKVCLGIIFVSALPIIIEVLKAKLGKKNA
jgi:membrane-associated protein